MTGIKAGAEAGVWTSAGKNWRIPVIMLRTDRSRSLWRPLSAKNVVLWVSKPQNDPKISHNGRFFPKQKPIPQLVHRVALEPPIPRPVPQSGTGDSLVWTGRWNWESWDCWSLQKHHHKLYTTLPIQYRSGSSYFVSPPMMSFRIFSRKSTVGFLMRFVID